MTSPSPRSRLPTRPLPWPARWRAASTLLAALLGLIGLLASCGYETLRFGADAATAALDAADVELRDDALASDALTPEDTAATTAPDTGAGLADTPSEDATP